jgi:membrane associated rhomboid family serine protease/Zn-finger nucleic acid-binding protein
MLSFLRKVLRREAVNALWQKVQAHPIVSKMDCPFCCNAMKKAVHLVPDGVDGQIEIDVCTLCPSLWFDTHELETLGRHHARPPEKAAPLLSPKAREILALAEIERIREKANNEESATGMQPADGWLAIMTIFGIPVVEDSPALSRWPFVTWGTVLLMLLATLWAWCVGPPVAGEWGLLPSESLRRGGWTFLTSFFIHAGFLHLFSNAMFLLMFGDRTEDYLGHGKYLLLLAGSALTGDLIHLWLDGRSNMPLVGASGGVSGVIAYYALRFPRARLVAMVRLAFVLRWVRMTAWFGFVLWILLQFAGVYLQMNGISFVSSLAHVGGALFGVIFWAIAVTAEKWGDVNRVPSI